MLPPDEVNTALKFLESRGHNVGIAHFPPVRVGNELRVWIDNISRSFDEALLMARAEGMMSAN